jgi:hypothetical protein
VLVPLAIGISVTLVSAFVPARKAARVPPVAAMRDVAVDESGRSGRRTVLGAVLLVIGAGAVAVGLLVDVDVPFVWLFFVCWGDGRLPREIRTFILFIFIVCFFFIFFCFLCFLPLFCRDAALGHVRHQPRASHKQMRSRHHPRVRLAVRGGLLRAQRGAGFEEH